MSKLEKEGLSREETLSEVEKPVGSESSDLTPSEVVEGLSRSAEDARTETESEISLAESRIEKEGDSEDRARKAEADKEYLDGLDRAEQELKAKLKELQAEKESFLLRQVDEQITAKREAIKLAEKGENETEVLKLENELRALERKKNPEPAEKKSVEDIEDKAEIPETETKVESQTEPTPEKQTPIKETREEPSPASAEAIRKKPEDILRGFNLDNRNFLQKLPENAWKFFKNTILKPPLFVLKAFAGKIKHETSLKIEEAHRKFGFVGSRIGILFNSALIDREKTGWFRHGTSLEGLQEKFDQADEEIKELNGSLEELDSQEKEMEEEGLLRPSVRMKIEHARDKIKQKIEKAQNIKKSLENRLAEAKDRIKRYEEERAVMIKDLLDRLEPNITPLVEAIDEIKTDKENLESEIAEHSSFLNEKQVKLDEILQKMEKYPGLKSIMKSRKKGMERTIKETKRRMETSNAELRSLNKRLSNLNERANPWIEMRNKFQRILEREPESA